MIPKAKLMGDNLKRDELKLSPTDSNTVLNPSHFSDCDVQSIHKNQRAFSDRGTDSLNNDISLLNSFGDIIINLIYPPSPLPCAVLCSECVHVCV